MTIAYPDTVADFLYDKDIGTKYVVNFDNYINDPELTFGTDKYLGDKEGKDDIVKSYLEEGQQFVVDDRRKKLSGLRDKVFIAIKLLEGDEFGTNKN